MGMSDEEEVTVPPVVLRKGERLSFERKGDDLALVTCEELPEACMTQDEPEALPDVTPGVGVCGTNCRGFVQSLIARDSERAYCFGCVVGVVLSALFIWAFGSWRYPMAEAWEAAVAILGVVLFFGGPFYWGMWRMGAFR